MNGLALLALAWSAGPFTAKPLPDPVLDSQRGGFRLPSGIDVAIAVDTQTAINGAVVLRTTFRADQGTPTVTIYVPKDGVTVPAASRNAGAGAASSSPTVTYDRQHGIEVSSTGGVMPNVTVGGTSDANTIPDGLQVVAGGTANTNAGNVSEGKLGSADAVTLSAGDLSVSHLTGGAFGSVITNTGNDRAIDTQTTLSISLSNAGPDTLGSAMLRAVDVTAGALQTRMN